MNAVEWVRFIIGAALLVFGVFIFIVQMIGVFKFNYVLNRMHAAAMGDTLGLGSSLLGLIVINGFDFTSFKLFIIIVFLWFSSPVSSHLITRLEMTTDEHHHDHYKVFDLHEHDLPTGTTQDEQEEVE